MMNRWKSISFISIFTFLCITCILGILQPFDIDKLPIGQKINYLLILGFIGSVISAVSYLPIIKWIDDKSSQYGYLPRIAMSLINIPLNAMAIATVNFYLFEWQVYNWSFQFCHLLWNVTAVVAFIHVIDYLIYRSNNLKAEILELKRINDFLSHNSEASSISPEPSDNSNLISLNGTTMESLSVNPANILFAVADANYISVHYLKNNDVMIGQLRQTMKQIESDLSDYPFLKRCHRAYIVNINHICHVEGNNKGYKLQLTNTSTEIPVSRAFISSLASIHP